MALDVLSSLMNTMVVQLMDAGLSNGDVVARYASENALLG
jgi:hypothetical protein